MAARFVWRTAALRLTLRKAEHPPISSSPGRGSKLAYFTDHFATWNDGFKPLLAGKTPASGCTPNLSSSFAFVEWVPGAANRHHVAFPHLPRAHIAGSHALVRGSSLQSHMAPLPRCEKSEMHGCARTGIAADKWVERVAWFGP
jgi:hypothetical protein